MKGREAVQWRTWPLVREGARAWRVYAREGRLLQSLASIS